jgi:peroxiredoxin
MLSRITFGIMVGCALSVSVSAAEPVPPLGSRIADFTLTEAKSGKPWSLATESRQSTGVAVIFVGAECPASNAYIPTLNKLAKEFSQRGITIVGINSNAHDDVEVLKKHIAEYEIQFPILKDSDGQLAAKFRAERVPTAYVLDGSRTVRYMGRIDDQYERGVMRPQATAQELRDALEALLSGKAVKVESTSVIGCPINFGEASKTAKKATTVTYSKEVSRILQKNCLECHRAGEAGPFQLTNFKQAKAWSAAIREVVSEGIMPPWHADPKYGQFKNDRRLSASDKQAVLDWIDGGCPEGNPTDLPTEKVFSDSWIIGKPDKVLTMNQEFQVPAQAPKGGIPYQYIFAGEAFAEDTWVTAAEIRPSARAVLHHVIAFILRPGQKVGMLKGQFDTVGEVFGAMLLTPRDFPQQLAGFVPGSQAWVTQPGMAKKIPKGSRIVFELHYTPNGKACTDLTKIGLQFSKGKPKEEIFVELAINEMFTIPAKKADHKVVAEYKFKNDFCMTTMFPHMHLRGKSFEYKLFTPDGKEEILLNVPHYDFNWQQGYDLVTPKVIPKKSKLVCTAVFDNSEKNPFNPDPTKVVKWGDQTWEEMMIGFFEGYDLKKK